MTEFLERIERWPVSTWVKESPVWGEPTVLTLHTMGMMVVAGTAAIIALRLLGIARGISIKPLDRLFPFAWWGFWINAATGTLLLMAEATKKLTNPDFYVKMVFVFSGVALLAIMRRKIFGSPALDRGELPPNAKSLAWLSLACWFGAITAGRLLAYIGMTSGQ